MSLQSQIQTALLQQNIQATDAQLNQLTHYCEALNKWNKAYNLTAIRNINDMIPHHIVDSLTLLPFLSGKTCLDVGTGGGLPGIPLAIMCPEMEFYLLDSNGKKTRFLNQMKFELVLDNIHVLNERIESYYPDFQLDTICSRAFASLKDFMHATKPLHHPGITLLAMKSVKANSEVAESDLQNLQLEQHEVHITGIDAQRQILSLHYKA